MEMLLGGHTLIEAWKKSNVAGVLRPTERRHIVKKPDSLG
jgi:hypothetical protein